MSTEELTVDPSRLNKILRNFFLEGLNFGPCKASSCRGMWNITVHTCMHASWKLEAYIETMEKLVSAEFLQNHARVSGLRCGVITFRTTPNMSVFHIWALWWLLVIGSGVSEENTVFPNIGRCSSYFYYFPFPFRCSFRV